MAFSKEEYAATYREVREVTEGDFGNRDAVIASFLEEVLNQPYNEEEAVGNLLGAHASVTALVDGYGLLAELDHRA